MSEDAVEIVKALAVIGLTIFVIGLACMMGFMDHDGEKERNK